jgi:hypothetical protein
MRGGWIFGEKERNKSGDFEGGKRVKEQKKKTNKEIEERRRRTIGYCRHSCHHDLHRSSQSTPTTTSS